MKVGETVKIKKYSNEAKRFVALLKNIPIVQKVEVQQETESGFFCSAQFATAQELFFEVVVLSQASPKKIFTAKQYFEAKTPTHYGIVMAPYISVSAGENCKNNNLGYLDEAGNCLLDCSPIYVFVQGRPNPNPERRATPSLFRSGSTVTSSILRTMLADVKKTWKLAELAQEVECSIGQVAKVKDALCEQRWAQMDQKGLLLIEPLAMLNKWSQNYRYKEPTVSCYTLDSVAEFEKKLTALNVPYALTGFSGGVRYTPVVRYNRIHVLVAKENIEEFIAQADCKRVDAGANVVIYTASKENLLNTQVIAENVIASPVQVYLDCMQLKGRGEELAEAVYNKEIGK